jgi:hypothetical protein
MPFKLEHITVTCQNLLNATGDKVSLSGNEKPNFTKKHTNIAVNNTGSALVNFE